MRNSSSVRVLCLLSATAAGVVSAYVFNHNNNNHGVCRETATDRTLSFEQSSSSWSGSSSTLALFGGRRYETSLFMAGRPRRPQAPVREVKPVMNDEITARELRVVAPNPLGKDEPLGILSLEDALAKASEMGNLDLIMVNGKSDPPVCKIVDYSKYKYMQEKKAKEVKKKSKATEVKEVKMSYKIDVHDYEVRRKNALRFLKQGNRVKCTVMFRGREVQHDKLGFDLLEKLAGELEDTCAREGRPKREGRNLSLILSPRAEVLKAVNEGRKSQEKAKKKKKVMALEERRASKAAAAVATATAAGVAANGAVNGDAAANANGVSPDPSKGLDEEDDDDMDAELSLDELLGSDDFTDKLFS